MKVMRLVVVGIVLLVHVQIIESRHKQSRPVKGSGRNTMVFNKDIVELAKQNSFFRKEIVTGDHSQIVLMSVPAGSDIGMETHKVDQVLVFVQGRGQAILNGQVSEVTPYHLVFVPAGTEHNFKNTGSQDLKLFTVYAPAHHKPGALEKTKQAEY